MKTFVEATAAVIVWTCVVIIITLFVAVYLTVYAVYFSVTWPWYLYRALRRIALPR